MILLSASKTCLLLTFFSFGPSLRHSAISPVFKLANQLRSSFRLSYSVRSTSLQHFLHRHHQYYPSLRSLHGCTRPHDRRQIRSLRRLQWPSCLRLRLSLGPRLGLNLHLASHRANPHLARPHLARHRNRKGLESTRTAMVKIIGLNTCRCVMQSSPAIWS